MLKGRSCRPPSENVVNLEKNYPSHVLRTKVSDYVSVFNRELLCFTRVVDITKSSCELEIVDHEKIKSEN